MSLRARLGFSLALGALTSVAAFLVASPRILLRPGEAAWSRLVRGAGADGVVRQPAVIVLPGFNRGGIAEVILTGDDAEAGTLLLALDGAPARRIRLDPERPVTEVAPKARIPGLRVDLRPSESGGARLKSIAFRSPRPAWGPVALLGMLSSALTFILVGHLPFPVALSLAFAAAGFLSAALAPALLFLMLPSTGALLRVLAPLLLLLAGTILAARSDPGGRALCGRGVALLAGAVFGAWVRLFFLYSAGSWDTEYWKAWMNRAASHGVVRVYGDPDAVPAGSLRAQLRGDEELWKITSHGRLFVVDYPPLAMTLWRWSWALVGSGNLDYAEAQNVSVKLPAVIGDVVAMAVLIWALRDRLQRALALAILYWALPVSWLSSAVLGYLDGAYAPLVLLALLAAGRHRSSWAGALLALACLLKPTAVVAAPAIAAALLASGGRIVKAVVAGLLVIAIALAPFAWSGTLETAIVHVYRILFQGTLSGGYPNPWWLLGHFLSLGGGEPLSGAVKFARTDLLPFPVRPLGAALFGLVAVMVVFSQRRVRGPGAAALSGACLFFAYAMLAIGVHENHPHPLFVILVATGLLNRRLQIVAAGTSAIYVLNMLMLSGLGRFYSQRYVALEPLVRSIAHWRLALGFDATLVLALLNTALFAFFLVMYPAQLRQLSPGPVNS